MPTNPPTPSPAPASEAETPQFAFRTLDGQDWGFNHARKVLRVGNVEAPLHAWIASLEALAAPTPESPREARTMTDPMKPDADEMQRALAACGIEWDTDWITPAANTWAVMGLENGGESADSCEAAIRRMMDAAEYDGRRAEREKIEEVLRAHWLTDVQCHHEAQTDTAHCFCTVWASGPLPSVGEAVEAWIAHVVEELGR